MQNDKTLTASDYVTIISDVLRMKKNLCLCRHFHRMDKSLVLRSTNIKYIDVWPINVFDPKNEDPFDVVSLFMMQLSCIINMLPAWKRLHLRVFLCESDNPSDTRYSINLLSCSESTIFFLNDSNFTVNSFPYDRPAEYKLKQLLKSLRITATIHQIPEWSSNENFMRHSAVLKQFTHNADNELMAVSEENINRSKLYMQG